MKRLLIIILLIPLMASAKSRIHNPQIRSMQVVVNQDWLSPAVMRLGTNDVLNISFDELSHNYHRYIYKVEHCEADWATSEDIFESDWLEGFNNNTIDDYENSVNTTVAYTHYRLQIPNERCRLKMSGNYRLHILDEDNDNEEVMTVEFMVTEQRMNLSLSVTTNTDIDLNDSHQQVSMKLNYGGMLVTNPEDQIKTIVMQNGGNIRQNIKPNFKNANGLEWIHNKALIFDAGNEYHKFEVLDVSHPTMGIDIIRWDGTYYQAYPFPAFPQRNYLTDVDADGAFCIRNSDRTESDYTCDYVWVNYELQAPYQGELYIDGQWATDVDKEHYRMRYDGNRKAYYTALLQKQGYYNYRYLTADRQIPASEGNFYQTENRYQVLVYYKEVGGRTWRLVGYKSLELR